MIIHAVRCDQDKCQAEARLVETPPLAIGADTTYEKPAHWLKYDGKDFDSHGCVAAYAMQKQREWEVARQNSVAHQDPYE